MAYTKYVPHPCFPTARIPAPMSNEEVAALRARNAEIVRRRGAGESYTAIAARFGISRERARQIANAQTAGAVASTRRAAESGERDGETNR